MGRALDHAGFLYPKGYLFGLILSTAGSSATFGITAGEAVDSTGLGYMVLPSAYTKTTAAWVLGTGVGGLDTGAIANNTWYHVYLIRRPDTGVVDVLYSLSATAPTLPANYTQFRRIGSMKVGAGGAWQLFYQIGDEFVWDVPIADVSGVAPGAGTIYTLASIPLNVTVKVNGLFTFTSSVAAAFAVIHAPLTSNQAPNTPAGNFVGYTQAANGFPTDRFSILTSSQSLRISTNSTGTILAYIVVSGWIDTRGKLQ